MAREAVGAGKSQMVTPKTAGALRLPQAWLRPARALWVGLALVALGILLAALPGYGVRAGGQLAHVTGNEAPPGAHFFALASAVASLASTFLSLGLALLLFRRRFAEPMAAFLSFFLLIYAVVMAGPIEHAASYWLDSLYLAQTAQAVLLATPMIALLMLFPSGQFVPRWTRWVVLLSVPWSLSLLAFGRFDAESFSRNPAAVIAMALLFVGFVLSGIYAQIYRYRTASSAMEREQVRWAVYGFALWIAYMAVSTLPYIMLTGLPAGAPTPWWAPASELGWWLSLNILPVCLTVAVMRYRLWDIDLVVNRTLVYGGLTAALLALYGLVVGGMGLLFRTQDSLVLPLVATGLAALLFQPLRLRLQQRINRLMYGERDEPFEVLARLGRRLESTLSPEMVYPTIVETVSQALKLPYVAVAVWREGRLETVESYGRPVADAVAYPMSYQGAPVGRLLVARRATGEAFSPGDERLLQSVARQAGPAVHAVQLMADLQQSRQRLVAAREEERRRLRRDLHDGLGPQLASQTLTIDAIDKLLARDPERAQALLHDLKRQSQAAIVDIRQLVYGLRPPALDELGLVGALREGAARKSHNGLQIQVEAPESLPALPAAVEVAAYRIAQEALTNVARHAGASHCAVRLWVEGVGTRRILQVEVRDDGHGLPPDYRPGVGLQSMQERAAELGGSCRITGMAARGTRVTARLPLLETE